MKIKNKKKWGRALFQWSGGDANQLLFLLDLITIVITVIIIIIIIKVIIIIIIIINETVLIMCHILTVLPNLNNHNFSRLTASI